MHAYNVTVRPTDRERKEENTNKTAEGTEDRPRHDCSFPMRACGGSCSCSRHSSTKACRGPKPPSLTAYTIRLPRRPASTYLARLQHLTTVNRIVSPLVCILHPAHDLGSD